MGFFDFLFKKKTVCSCPYSSTYVILDVETTGLNPSTDRIIQLSAIKYDPNGQPIETFDTYLNPERPIPPAASKVNGITDSMVANAPLAEDIRDKFFDFLGDDLLVGYNTTFDLKFIESTFDGHFTGCPYVDALSIAREAFNLPNYKLQTVAAHVGFKSSRFHNSLVDCEAVAAVLCRVAPNLQDWAREFGKQAKVSSKPRIPPGLTHYLLGEDERLAGNFEAALKLFEKAHYEGYCISDVYISIAKIYRKLKDYESEIAALDSGLSVCSPSEGRDLLAERRSRAQELLAHSRQKEAEKQQMIQAREARILAKQQRALQKAQAPHKDASRPIAQLSDTGEVIKEFPSVSAASRELNINAKCIRDAAKGRQKHAGGYRWQYTSNTSE